MKLHNVVWILIVLLPFLGLFGIQRGWNRILSTKKESENKKKSIFIGVGYILLGVILLWITIPLLLDGPHLMNQMLMK